MNGVYDDFQQLWFLRYIRNDAGNFSAAIKETVSQWKEDFERRKNVHSYVEENRSQSKELEMILSFVSELYDNSKADTRKKVNEL